MVKLSAVVEMSEVTVDYIHAVSLLCFPIVIYLIMSKKLVFMRKFNVIVLMFVIYFLANRLSI